MAFKMIDREYCICTDTYRCEFVCDTDADFDSLPEAGVGSIAVSVATGALRIVNASGKWVDFGKK